MSESTHTPEEARVRGHLLTIKNLEWLDDYFLDYDWEVACVAPDLCGGWWECSKEHRLEGIGVADISAADGPYDNDCPGWHGPYTADQEHNKRMQAESAQHLPWCDEDEFEFHGVLHTWRYGHNWTVPYDGCVVQTADGIVDSVDDIAREHGAGVFVVSDEWDDTDCTLIFVGPQQTIRDGQGGAS